MLVYWLLLASCCVTVLTQASVPEYPLEEANQLFEGFIHKYDKRYQDEEQKQRRFEIFKENLIHINHKNNETESDAFGITQFMDLKREEFLSMYTGVMRGGMPGMCTVLTDTDIPDANAPNSWDWRQQNAVTGVKDQQTCGSCYAFSSTGHLESQYAIKYKKIVTLSEQQIVDCDKTTSGCKGGLPTLVFRWIIDNGGIQSDGDYPYEGHDDMCRSNNTKTVLKITQCYSYELRSQDKVKQLLYKKGPLSIAIDANHLQFYWDGKQIYQNCGDTVGHAVLLVGYGTEGDQPYWIVKNSWGTGWGDRGYFRMIRGANISSCGMMGSDHIVSADIE